MCDNTGWWKKISSVQKKNDNQFVTGIFIETIVNVAKRASNLKHQSSVLFEEENSS